MNIFLQDKNCWNKLICYQHVDHTLQLKNIIFVILSWKFRNSSIDNFKISLIINLYTDTLKKKGKTNYDFTHDGGRKSQLEMEKIGFNEQIFILD